MHQYGYIGRKLQLPKFLDLLPGGRQPWTQLKLSLPKILPIIKNSRNPGPMDQVRVKSSFSLIVILDHQVFREFVQIQGGNNF